MQSTEEGNINIFMNLEEGILNQLLEENRKNEEVCNCVRNWKDVYENLKKVWFVWNMAQFLLSIWHHLFIFYGEKIRAPSLKDQTSTTICRFLLRLSQPEFSVDPWRKCTLISQFRKPDFEFDNSQSQKSFQTSTPMLKRLNFQLFSYLNCETWTSLTISSSLHMVKDFPQLDTGR